MPINVGTVEAVLQARDTMSPVMEAAAQKVVVLTNVLGNLGTTSVAEFRRLSDELTRAEQNLKALAGQGTVTGESLTAAGAAAMAAGTSMEAASLKMAGVRTQLVGVKDAGPPAAGAIEDVGKKAAQSGQSIAQMEGMATRLIERLAILYALRAGAEFIVDIFKSADALKVLSETSDLSVKKLQEIQYAAEHTGVPFDKASTAIAGLDKKLVEAKSSTGEALASIGLSFDKIFQLSPDQRINAIITALANTENPLVRARAEFLLLGTEGLDPLIMKFKDLSKEADESLGMMQESTVNALSNTLNMYKGFFTEFSGIAGNIIDKEQQMWSAGIQAMSIWNKLPPGDSMVNRFMTGMAMGGPTVAANLMFGSPVHESGQTLMSPLETTVPIQPIDPRIARIQQIRDEAAAVKDLTDVQRSWLEELKRDGVLTADNASLMNISLGQFKAYEAGLKAKTKAQTEAERAAREEASAEADLMKMWDLAAQAAEATGEKGLATKVEQLNRQEIVERDNWTKRFTAGKMQEETYWSGIEAIREKYIDLRQTADEQNQEKELKQWQANADDINRIETDTQNIRLQIGKTGLELKLAQLNKQADDEKAAFTKRYDAGTMFEEQYQQALYNIDLKYNALRQEAIYAAVRKLEDSAKGIEGPVPGLFTYAKPADPVNTLNALISGVGGLSTALSQLATISGNTFGDMVKDISRGIASVDAMLKAVKLDQPTKDKNDNWIPATAGATALAAAGYLTAAYAGAQALASVSDALETPQWQKVMDRVSHDWGVAISSGTAQGIVDSSKQIQRAAHIEYGTVDQFQRGNVNPLSHLTNSGVGYQGAATITNIGAAIKDAGGLSETNQDMFMQKYRDAFVALEKHELTVAETLKVIDSNWATFAENATDENGRISDSLRDIISLNDTFDLKSREIAAWRKQQGMDVITGVNAEIAGLTVEIEVYDKLFKKVEETWKALEEAKKAGKPQSEIDKLDLAYAHALGDQQSQMIATRPNLGALGSAVVGGVVTAVASGTSRNDAVKAESASLTALEKIYKDLNIQIDDAALSTLFMMNDMNKAAPEVIAGIGGISQQIVALDNLGLETVDNFHQQQIAGGLMYTHLQASAAALGQGTAAALLPMQDYLHRAKEEAEKLHVPLDANTQQMIEQSKELGIWDDKAKPVKSTTEKLADAVERLVSWLEKIPSNKTTTVTTRFETEGAPPEPPDPPPLHGGGYVSAGGITRFHEGGLSSDERLAVLQTGEGVLNRNATAYLGYDTIKQLNRGGGMGGGSMAAGFDSSKHLDRLTTSVEGLRQDMVTAVPEAMRVMARDGYLDNGKRRVA